LRGIKKYTEGNCHNIGIEMIIRNIKEFTHEELAIAFRVSVSLLCWDEIIKRFDREVIKGIFNKFKKLGYGEYENRFEKELEENNAKD
jgi:hypothetical protein